ncbi:MAG: HlyD family efflux transporter periplasmic adaptor subunit [Alphaproteobacteria bacterium]|nr:HlyD family efflux transporter periplasmic adaptor subunit [Alphaproteobacteria bacterium]
MAVTLFRQQAIDHQRHRIWGEVALSVPLSYTLVTGFLALSLLVAASFIATHTYSRKEHAIGFLLPTSGIARITPPRPGIISAVSVVEGQRVERGATLLKVTDTQTSEQGENLDATKADELRKQRGELQAQRALERDKTAVEEQGLQSRIESGEEGLLALQRQQAIQVDRINIAQRQMAGAIELAGKGYFSAVELRRRQDAYLAEQQSESALAREAAAKQAELGQLRDNLRQLPIATAQRTAQFAASISEIDARLTEIEGRRGYQVQAPIAGRVSTLQAWVGKTADPKIPVLSIVPADDVLEAELLIPARAIGYVAPGQTVQISYDTFPFAQFGFARGTVRVVSHTMLKPDEIVGPLQLREPSYPISVALQRQTVTAHGAELPLEPDLQLQADIVSEQRTLLAWILEPAFGAWRQR